MHSTSSLSHTLAAASCCVFLWVCIALGRELPDSTRKFVHQQIKGRVLLLAFDIPQIFSIQRCMLKCWEFTILRAPSGTKGATCLQKVWRWKVWRGSSANVETGSLRSSTQICKNKNQTNQPAPSPHLTLFYKLRLEQTRRWHENQGSRVRRCQ